MVGRLEDEWYMKGNLTSSCSKTPTRGLQFQSFVAFMILGLESSNTAKTFKAPAHKNA